MASSIGSPQNPPDSISTTDITVSNLTVSKALATDGSSKLVSSTTTSAELAFVAGVTSAIQTQLGTKIDTAGTGLNKSTTTLNLTAPVSVANGGTNSTSALNSNRNVISSGGAIVESAAIAANKALASNASGIPVASTTTDTELGYVAGVTSALQTQINAKATDASVVHNTGTETVDGAKTFTSQLKVTPGAATGTNYQIFQGDGGGTDNFHANQYRQINVTTTATQIALIDDFMGLVLVSGFDGTAARFADLVLCGFGTSTPVTIAQLATAGSPSSRTYSMVSNSQLKLAMGAGTYSINTTTFIEQSN